MCILGNNIPVNLLLVAKVLIVCDSSCIFPDWLVLSLMIRRPDVQKLYFVQT